MRRSLPQIKQREPGAASIARMLYRIDSCLREITFARSNIS